MVAEFIYVPKRRGTKILLDLINCDITGEGIALLASHGKKDKPNC
ncbi:hypothetical protein Mpsy_1825 [Methanolobus psychrophilus R15]|nr:hypothetical protein Mpsy_1825 [Methanolobus psychrophilus R15]